MLGAKTHSTTLFLVFYPCWTCRTLKNQSGNLWGKDWNIVSAIWLAQEGGYQCTGLKNFHRQPIQITSLIWRLWLTKIPPNHSEVHTSLQENHSEIEIDHSEKVLTWKIGAWMYVKKKSNLEIIKNARKTSTKTIFMYYTHKAGIECTL